MHTDPQQAMCVDPDIDIHSPDQRGELAHTHGTVLGVIAAGGALGALARDGLTLAWPTQAGGFPWAVFMINVAGSFLLGLLMVVITEIRPAHPLVRPFLGVGVLGGFTTFSTYANDFRALLHADTIVVAVAYLLATLLAALAATALAMKLARAAARLTQRETAR